jgi:hypothetical protein
MAFGGGPNRERTLNDLIIKEVPDPMDDYTVEVARSAINSMIRTAMRRGAEILRDQMHKYQITISNVELDNYHGVVRIDAVEKFMEDK